MLDSLGEIIRFRLPDDYWDRYDDRLRALALPSLNAAARRLVQPDQLVWVVVGDRAVIEPGLSDLGFSGIRLLDADGQLLDEPADAGDGG